MLKRGPRAPAQPRRHAARSGAVALGASLLLAGCGTIGIPGPSSEDAEIYRSAQRERSDYLERELARLRTDMREAEAAMVASDSELRVAHTRADAVSAVAEARIALQRAADTVQWRPEQLQEARDKLEEAERQLRARRSGGAVFFASRARRIADALIDEARHVAGNTSTRFIGATKANLRTGPSTQRKVVAVLPRETPVFPQREQGRWVLVRTLAGPVGWLHASLLRPR